MLPHSCSALTIPFASPLLLLALVALITFSYRYSKPLKVSSSTRQAIITFHAFATEGAQILLGAISPENVKSVIQAMANEPCTDSGIKRVSLTATAVCAVLALHIVCCLAINVVEARILLGEWRLSSHCACFVLTRNFIQICFRPPRIKRRRTSRKRTVSLPIIADRIAKHESSLLAPLKYLDLATTSMQERKLSLNPEWHIQASMTKIQNLPGWRTARLYPTAAMH